MSVDNKDEETSNTNSDLVIFSCALIRVFLFFSVSPTKNILTVFFAIVTTHLSYCVMDELSNYIREKLKMVMTGHVPSRVTHHQRSCYLQNGNAYILIIELSLNVCDLLWLWWLQVEDRWDLRKVSMDKPLKN